MRPIQETLQDTLRRFVMEQQTNNHTIGQQIRRPMLFITIGSRCREEFLKFVYPELEHHWPTSFSTYMNDHKVMICTVDRESTPPFEGENCFHYQLKGSAHADSLSEDEADCHGINQMLRDAISAMDVTGNQANNSRVVALTRVDDSDSCLTGDVMAIARQFCRDKLSCDRYTNGLLAAFLPLVAEREEDDKQMARFFRLLAGWSDRNASIDKLKPIYVRYQKDKKLYPPSDSIPHIYRTYVFDSVDANNVKCASNGRRAALLADVLELDGNGKTAVQVLGVKPTELNEEYAIACAMDLKGWNQTLTDELSRENAEEASIGDRLQSCLPEVKAELRQYLTFACITRYYERDYFDDSLVALEKRYFGNTMRLLYEEWEQKLLQRYSLPQKIRKMFSQSRNLEEIEAYEGALKKINQGRIEQRPELPEGDRRFIGELQSVAQLQQLLVERYCEMSTNSIYKLLAQWIEEGRKECKRSKERIRNEESAIREFKQVQQNVKAIQAELWKGSLPFGVYEGPELSGINRDVYDEYVKRIVKMMTDKDEKSVYELLRFVRSHISDMRFPAPERIKEIPMCRLNIVSNTQSQTVTIVDGVSKGKKLSFVSIQELGMIELLRKCGLEGVEITNFNLKEAGNNSEPCREDG